MNWTECTYHSITTEFKIPDASCLKMLTSLSKVLITAIAKVLNMKMG